MEGHVIAFVTAESDTPDSYWDGNAKTEDLDAAAFYPNRVEARMDAGRLQAANPQVEVVVLKAQKGIVLD